MQFLNNDNDSLGSKEEEKEYKIKSDIDLDNKSNLDDTTNRNLIKNSPNKKKDSLDDISDMG